MGAASVSGTRYLLQESEFPLIQTAPSHPQPGSNQFAVNRFWRALLSVARRQPFRMAILVFLHLSLFALVFLSAYLIRYDFVLPDGLWGSVGRATALVVAAKVILFYAMGHFHGWWRYVTFVDLRNLVHVSFLSMLLIAFLDYMLSPAIAIPRSTLLIDTLLTVIVIGGLRSTWRFSDEVFGTSIRRRQRRGVLLVGTDHRIGQLASQINSIQSMPCRVCGLLSTSDIVPRRAFLGGVRIVGSVKGAVEAAMSLNVNEILVPAGEVSGGILRSLMDRCNSNDMQVRVIPRFEDAMVGHEEIPLRPINIEDLLRRDPVTLDTVEVEKLLRGKCVLVTGAGGSIGSEICRQVLRFQPAELILLGRGENRIHAIYNELNSLALSLGVKLHIEIGDITDRLRMKRLFETCKPEIVFHAAAHKHVPLMELHPGEAVKNNIMGTKVIAALADKYNVGHLVMVSTDKAVNPTSIMGCSKHLAERVIYDFAQTSDTKFAIVRFGNVLGSAGSVIPIFQEQIRRGGPITITDKRMTRYFMSIPEASQLVIQAAAQCKGGEIFVLDMGDPIEIVQLAEDLVALSGLPKNSIEFEFTGIRPGEKLFEELYFSDEMTLETQHPKVRAAYPRDFRETYAATGIDSLIALADERPEVVRAAIKRLVFPETKIVEAHVG